MPSINWYELEYFNRDEFDYPDEMNPQLLRQLDTARRLAGVPFVITDDFRTSEENEALGGAKDSPHLYGAAVDIRVRGSRQRFKILSGLLRAGFNRLGVYDRHIHVDILDDEVHVPEVLWIGVSK